MRISVRSIYGAELQTAQILGLPYVPREDSTLNERFTIQQAATLPAGKHPTVQYLHVGLGGHRLTAGEDGIPLNAAIPHRATDAGLYKPVPWVLRLQSEDLTPAERAMFALRRSEVHNGENYFAYYLLRIDYADVTTELNSTQISDGVETTVPFIPNSSNLTPTPPNVVSDNVMSTLEQADYVSVSAIVTIRLNAWLVNEYIQATTTIYGSADYALISETALVSGVDRTVTAEGPGGVTFQFNEAIGAQAVSFMSDYIQLTGSDDTVELSFDVGTVEPLLTELVSGGVTGSGA